MRLSRTSFGGISIDGLRPGEYRPLRARELEKLEKKYLKAKRRQTEASSDE
jgi:16S rRNA U516 pseudouridylate synthase RsuA-like enzyme